MLEQYEKNSLCLIFDAIRSDDVLDVLECLLKTYQVKYSDEFSIKVVKEIINTVESIKDLYSVITLTN